MIVGLEGAHRTSAPPSPNTIGALYLSLLPMERPQKREKEREREREKEREKEH